MISIWIVAVAFLVSNVGADLSSVGAAKVIIHDSTSVAIYESVSIGNNASYVMGASGSNYDPQATLQYFLMNSGNNSVAWTYDGPDITVSASRHRDLVAGISYESKTGAASVIFWNTNSSEPLWSYSIVGDVYIPEERPIMVSKDGMRVVVVVNVKDTQPNSYHTRIYWFWGVDSRVPSTHSFDMGNNTWARACTLSGNGMVLAMEQDAGITVFDIKSREIRFEQSFAASTAEICMSHDGAFVGTGFETFTLLGWDKSAHKYNVLYTLPPVSGFFVGACGISDNRYLAVARFRDDYKLNTVDLYLLAGTTQNHVWTYTATVGTGLYQDFPFFIAMSNAAEVIALGSWGDGSSTPTVTVLSAKSNVPLYKLMTPGSMFDVDAVAANGYGYVAAAGKHVHANVFGDGGDLYVVQIPLK